ncbi:hypothetical protein [Vibrio coralliirubri]|uniref:hypothetical protein n=1 Tax=Vibrio coralliirubri TaxID=1516159 RepID=UPI00069C0377|nr:hypothetical protein [Vibrio coralliirubri]
MKCKYIVFLVSFLSLVGCKSISLQQALNSSKSELICTEELCELEIDDGGLSRIIYSCDLNSGGLLSENNSTEFRDEKYSTDLKWIFSPKESQFRFRDNLNEGDIIAHSSQFYNVYSQIDVKSLTLFKFRCESLAKKEAERKRLEVELRKQREHAKVEAQTNKLRELGRSNKARYIYNKPLDLIDLPINSEILSNPRTIFLSEFADTYVIERKLFGDTYVAKVSAKGYFPDQMNIIVVSEKPLYQGVRLNNFYGIYTGVVDYSGKYMSLEQGVRVEVVEYK